MAIDRKDPEKYAGGPAKGGDQRRPERRLHTLRSHFHRKLRLLGYRIIPGIAESTLTAANRANTQPRRRNDVRAYGAREVRIRRIGNRRRSRAFLLTPVPTYSQAIARHRRWPQHLSQTYCSRIRTARSMGSIRRGMLEGPRRSRSWIAGAQATSYFKTLHMRSKAASARVAHCPTPDLNARHLNAWRLAAAPSLFFNYSTRIGDKSPPARS